MSVLLETTAGDIVIDLYTKDRPRCTLNFLKLCKLKMYNYCLVHSVQRNFVIQTGDIDQKGGSSVFQVLYGEQAKLFEKEDVPKVKHSKKLTVSMVNDGNGYHGSQFLITTTENADALDGLHTVFGFVSEGEEVVDQINESYCDEQGRPYQDIRIHHTIVLHDPFPDPEMLPVPPRSPSPPPSVIDSDRLAVGETVNKLAGHTTEEVVEFIEEKELRANTQMLEIIGDIPDADVKPPENVLFVCKLNPVTTSDDLEIIFSRFGTIESCEVIRDWKTGDSLCYAFIEFEDVTACEAAYFKMDNVLIDERRVHVDFSQSVSKLYWNRNTKNQLKYSDENKSKTRPRQEQKSRRDYDDNKSRRPEHGIKPRGDYNSNKSRRYYDHRESKESENRYKSRRNEDHIKSRRDEDYVKSRRDEDHVKSRRYEDNVKSRRDEDHIKSRRDEDNINSRRDEDRIKSRRDEDHIKSRRDEDHIKSRRDEDHITSRRDENHIKSRRDDDNINSRRDEDRIKSRRDEDRIKSRNDEDHIKSRRDDDQIKSRRDEDRTKSRKIEDNSRSRRDESEVKSGRDGRKDYSREDSPKGSFSSRDLIKGVKSDKIKHRKEYEEERDNKCSRDADEVNRKRMKAEKKEKKTRTIEKSEINSDRKNKREIESEGLRGDSKCSKKKRGEMEKRESSSEERHRSISSAEEDNATKARELQKKIGDLERKIKKMKEEDLEESSGGSVKKQKKKKHKKRAV